MRKILIMGAGGRDFHNFNTCFRNREEFQVVAFTAAQIPGIENRSYPPELAGRNYPQGIPILSEDRAAELVAKEGVDLVVLAYSDLSHQEVMSKASVALAAGADFQLLGPRATSLKAKKPVISVCATRTGAGKTTIARRICRLLAGKGIRFVVVRHPMAYGDLRTKVCQRFATMEDLAGAGCTLEELEEFEPHIADGNVVFAGVNYGRVLEAAEAEADVIVWDGGNNDLPFFQSDFHIIVADAQRPGHEITYYPSGVSLRLADAVIINKVGEAPRRNVEVILANVRRVNPRAMTLLTTSRMVIANASAIRGRRVLVVEDGPTVTHGGLSHGIGYAAARRYRPKEIIDPRKFARGRLKETYKKYPHIGPVLPTLGYTEEQLAELKDVITRSRSEAIVMGSQLDIQKVLGLGLPIARVSYELEELGRPNLQDLVEEFLSRR